MNHTGNNLPACSVATKATWFICILLLCAVHGFNVVANETNRPARPDRFISYTNVVDPELPLSIHVVKIEYTHPEVQFCTTLGGGEVMGMNIVSEQVKSLSRDLGQPLAAINADFYDESADYPVRPRDVQIRQGELVTQPTGHASFWMDAQGRPHMTNIHSRFHVVWSDGKTTPVGLNVPRTNNAAVIYTAALGKSTRTKGGVEYILEPAKADEQLPLRIGRNQEFRVRSVQNTGNNSLDAQTLVLSVGPGLISSVPTMATGTTVRIVTETIPDLSGSTMAIGGGPALVKGGKVMEWKGWIQVRHPRTAVGWNKKHLFLVQVDGRQLDVSLGMTFAELAAFMVKLGCEEAMNFDGGGSSTLWAFGKVQNSPSEGQERPSPNTLVVVRKNSASEGAK